MNLRQLVISLDRSVRLGSSRPPLIELGSNDGIKFVAEVGLLSTDERETFLRKLFDRFPGVDARWSGERLYFKLPVDTLASTLAAFRTFVRSMGATALESQEVSEPSN